MNPRNTLILAGVAAALGVFVWLYQVRGGEERAAAEAESKRLFAGVEAEAVTAIELATNDGYEARVERSDGVWSLVKPLVFPGDETTLSGMASTLAQLTSETALEDPQGLEVYGLGEGAREVRFEVGDQLHSVRFGKKTPIDYNTYVTVDGAEKVYTVGSHRSSAFDRPLLDLRERRVLRFDRNAVEQVSARWPGGAVTLEKSGDAWRLTSPLEGPADQRTVDDLLADLSFLRADGFIDEPGADEEDGFVEPAFRATIRLAPGAEGGEARELTMTVSSALPGARRAVRAAEASLYEIGSERLDDFPRRLGAYRYRTLAEFAASDARSVEMTFPDAGGVPVVIRASHSETGWSSEPEAVAAGRLARIVTELSSLRAEDVEAESAGAAELMALGLEPPRARFVVRGADPEAAPLAQVELGEFDTSRGILARSGEVPTLYRLDYGLAEHLPVSLDALRNRFLSQESEEEPEEEGAGLPELELD